MSKGTNLARLWGKEITILQRSVRKNYIHILLFCPPSMASSKMMQYLKGDYQDYNRMKLQAWKNFGTAFIGKRKFLCNRRNSDGKNYIVNQSMGVKMKSFGLMGEFSHT